MTDESSSERPQHCEPTRAGIRGWTPPTWHGGTLTARRASRATVLALVSTVALVVYFCWLLRPGPRRQPGAVRRAARRRAVQRRAGARVLVDMPRRAAPARRPAAASSSARPPRDAAGRRRVHPDLQRAGRDRRGDRRRGDPDARRQGARRPARRRQPRGDGAARRPATACATCVARSTTAPRPATSTTPSARTDAPFVLVLDCDHVADPRHARATLPEFVDRPWPTCRRRSTTPTPAPTASPARRGASRRCSSARSPGQGRPRSMFCCGTNVVFRRQALEEVGGFPTGRSPRTSRCPSTSTSAAGTSVYVPEVLAAGSDPEDLASYVSQQHRWARGCLGMHPARCWRSRCRCAQGCSTCCRRRTSCPAGRCSCTCRCR